MKPSWTHAELIDNSQRWRELVDLTGDHHIDCQCKLCLESLGLYKNLRLFTEDQHATAVSRVNQGRGGEMVDKELVTNLSEVKPMKLSEAIREGAKLRPQGFGSSFTTNANGELCSCAWGAAHEGLSGSPEITFAGAIMWKTHLKESKSLIKNPITGRERMLSDTVIDLNDVHKWTREQIADYIESLGY